MVEINDISKYITIVAGSIMCLFGLIGNLLNIGVFYSWSFTRTQINKQQTKQKTKQQKTGNSPLYLLMSSIANLIVVIYALPTRILFDGFQYYVSTDRIFFLCKFRYYCLHTFDLISLTCLCMATIDRYLISSREVRRRQLSTTKRGTKLIILSIICIHSLHSIPLIVYFSASTSGSCFVNSSIYLYYYRYTFQIIFHGIIPLITFSLFGYLTSKQLKSFRTRQNFNVNFHIDRQLSRMLFLMSIAIVCSSIPYSAENIYYLIFTDQTQQQTPIVLFLHNISSLCFYTNPVCCFYIYFISTSNFRFQVKKIFLAKQFNNRVGSNQTKTVAAIIILG